MSTEVDLSKINANELKDAIREGVKDAFIDLFDPGSKYGIDATDIKIAIREGVADAFRDRDG